MTKQSRKQKAESRNRALAVLLISAFCFLFSTFAFAASGLIPLAWNPSISPNVNAYRIYAWTNSPDTNCVATNAVQILTVGNVTNATLVCIVPASYTFAATALVTNTGAESPFSNFAYWQVPFGPTYLITVQSSTNLMTWTNTQMFFRLQIAPQP
jgi:hypothetical protein